MNAVNVKYVNMEMYAVNVTIAACVNTACVVVIVLIAVHVCMVYKEVIAPIVKYVHMASLNVNVLLSLSGLLAYRYCNIHR